MITKPKDLTSRERVFLAIRHTPADRVPKGELCIDDAVIRQALNCKKVGFAEKLAFVNAMGLDIYTMAPTFLESGTGLPKPGDSRWQDIEQWSGQTTLFTFATIDGAFDWGLRTLGFSEFFTLHQTSPLALQELIGKVEELNLSMLQELANSGINGVIIADDIAYQRGLFASPETLRQYFFPSMTRQVEEAARRGIPVFYHSDGNYREIIPDLIDMGVKGLHCIDRNSGMDITDLQAEFAKELCLWGHLDVNDIRQARNETYLSNLTKAVGKLTEFGGFILGTNSGFFADIDIEGIKAIYQSC